MNLPEPLYWRCIRILRIGRRSLLGIRMIFDHRNKNKNDEDIQSVRLTSSSAGDSSSSPLNAKKEGSPVNVDVNFSALSPYSELIVGNALRT